jgi:hypothetical protein
MSERFEWAHASDGFRVVGPFELAELAPDGNPDGDWGVAFVTGSNGCMLYGTPDELRRLLLRAHNALPHDANGDRFGDGSTPPTLPRLRS